MNYCVNCKMNLGNMELIEKEGNNHCPKCETEVMKITNKRLVTVIQDITDAFYNLNEKSVTNNAKSIIENAKIIEQGERWLQSQLNRRNTQLKQLHFEIAVIESIAETLKYDL